jgi:hypothetical protein
VGTGKGIDMGRRSNNLQARNRAMLGLFLPTLLLLLLIVAGIYIYKTNNAASSSAYEDVISDCVRDRTRVSTSSGVQDKATSDCVRDTAPDTGR